MSDISEILFKNLLDKRLLLTMKTYRENKEARLPH